MLEKLLKLDEKGIIAKSHWNDKRYLAEGSTILEAAARLEVTEEYRQAFREKHGALVYHRGNVSERVAELLASEFKTDVVWMPLLHSDSRGGDNGWAVNTGRINGIGNTPAVVLFPDGSDTTIHHECIHLIRDFVYYSMYKEFEETFANYLNIHKSHALFPFDAYSNEKAILKALGRLEEAVGTWAGYALIRLAPSEIRRIGSAKNPFLYLKGMQGLRHRIIKERIGI